LNISFSKQWSINVSLCWDNLRRMIHFARR